MPKDIIKQYYEEASASLFVLKETLDSLLDIRLDLNNHIEQLDSLWPVYKEKHHRILIESQRQLHLLKDLCKQQRDYQDKVDHLDAPSCLRKATNFCQEDGDNRLNKLAHADNRVDNMDCLTDATIDEIGTILAKLDSAASIAESLLLYTKTPDTAFLKRAMPALESAILNIYQNIKKLEKLLL